MAATYGAVAACASIVGVSDLTAPAPEPEEPPDAGRDVELLPDTSKLEADDGIVVQPPVDAGCDASLIGPLAPSEYRFESKDDHKMNWLNDPKTVQDEGANEFTLPSAALSGGFTTSVAVKFQGFKPFVPNNKRIVGLAVTLKARASDPDFFKDFRLRVALDADGTISSGDHSNPTPWPTKSETRTYGGLGTLWELEKVLTPATVNAADFGIVYVLSKPTNYSLPAFYLDSVRATIFVCD